MLELLDYLGRTSSRFSLFRDGADFIRVFAEETYRVTPEQVVGSTSVVKFRVGKAGPALMKMPEVEVLTDDPGNLKVGRLDKALGLARARDWTIVDMAADWNAVFPFQRQRREPDEYHRQRHRPGGSGLHDHRKSSPAKEGLDHRPDR